MSVPRFLWWERNVVSFWYLYSASQELDAMIMEINNSFDEKRNVLFQLQPESESPTAKIDLAREPKIFRSEEDCSVASFVAQCKILQRYLGKAHICISV